MLYNISEAGGNFDDEAEAEHGRLIPRVGRTYDSLHCAGYLSGAVPVASFMIRYLFDGLRALGDVLCPACFSSVWISKPCLNASHIKVPEVEKVKVLINMEVLSLDPMESRSPL